MKSIMEVKRIGNTLYLMKMKAIDLFMRTYGIHSHLHSDKNKMQDEKCLHVMNRFAKISFLPGVCTTSLWS